MNEFKKGLNQEVIKEISRLKEEDERMLSIRLKAYESFLLQKNPLWCEEDLKDLDFDDFIYFKKNSFSIKDDWNEVDKDIKNIFEKLDVIETEKKYLDGVNAQYESESVYHSFNKELEDKKIIFLDSDTAYKKHPELFLKYFNKLVPYTDNKYAALNTSVWSGGTFIYVPKNTKLDKPLHSYFRLQSKNMGQFERTLIILDENSSLHYIEGCTAEIYDENNLHAAVVEIYVEKNSEMKYTTIQNWSDNVLNYVTKRAIVQDDASMTWVDGNLGSKHNIKFPTCILMGKNSSGNCISIAKAKANVIQDTGAKMIHIGENTKSSIISKTIGYENSKTYFRGYVNIKKSAKNSYSKIVCDNLLLSSNLESYTYPYEKIENMSSVIEHEAQISKISEEQLFFLTSRGFNNQKAENLLVLGFIDQFNRELPMEYAVELNRLMK